MNLKLSLKILGIMLMGFSLSMLTPIIVSSIYHEQTMMAFATAFFITFVIGFLSWYYGRHTRQQLRARDGFMVVFLMWVTLSLFAALPFMLAYSPHVSLTDAMFESVSGLTTTGVTTFSYLDDFPMSILYYRQQLQFLGGMGIIVLAVAIMPMIGVGGMQLYKTEISGPMKDNKLTPRITETAKALWLLYCGLNILCTFSYWMCGMSFFDALSYSFSTIATGGFAPHTASIAYYSDPTIYVISIFFMIVGGANFSLHYLACIKRSAMPYWRDAEFRQYIFIYGMMFVLFSVVLVATGHYGSWGMAILHGVYQVVAFGTTTGFISDNYFHVWPLFLPVLLMLLGMLGACAGSTTGGIKIIRLMMFQGQVKREVNRLIHPSGMFPLKFGSTIIPDRVMNSLWSFLCAYIMVFILLWLAVMASGLDVLSAFSAAASCLANVGPALGTVSNNFSSVNDVTRWILIVAMLLGRLEIFTILVLLSPTFWKG